MRVPALIALSLFAVSASAGGTILGRQTDDKTQDCIISCTTKAAQDNTKKYQQCATQSTLTEQQKCFCKEGLYDAAGACLKSCFASAQADAAIAQIKQDCADVIAGKPLPTDLGGTAPSNPVQTGTGNNAASRLGGSVMGVGMVLVGAASAVIAVL
ncbi:hypothetical protein AURDEDRAFT_188761 [Auricularia subglabra TFB-10046 SS5]|uniref:Extracellular membrane protein CFEM domain-containing protein n=1 Tax=Auricularia subglabra (strain TFB-10046 / SS5) TaxID=717982 RepID=J0WRL8_AURST|nr:hypothetical protein AURDEDRAFT_188761 [Auricularia subglabra TFB-10046 SS5]